jgi:putative transposase
LVGYWARKYEVEIWAYCLMCNHAHFIAVPSTSDGLSRAFAIANQLYAEAINKREGWTGSLWQGRFWSYPMDEVYLYNAVRYVERNPVEAGLVAAAEAYRWSSAAAHIAGRDDSIVKVAPMLERVSDWRAYLAERPTSSFENDIELRQRTGWPAGSNDFVAGLEGRFGRRLRPSKPGPKPETLVEEGPVLGL